MVAKATANGERAARSLLLLSLAWGSGCATKFNAAPDSGMTSMLPVGAAGTSTQPGATAGVPAMGGVAGMAAVGVAGASSVAGRAPGTGAAGMSAAGTGAGAGMGAPTAGGAGTGMAQAGMGGITTGDAGPAPDASSGPPPPDCSSKAAPTPGDTPGTIQVGGTMRNYILHIPPGYSAKMPVALVTDWHAILIDAQTERNISGWADESDKQGFVVVFPNGIDNAWNIGDCCTTSRTVDDVGFARALVAKLEDQLCIDPKQVFATGYSMGGGMSYKLACDATDLIAGIAPAAFDLMVDSEWPCHPSRPITVISFRGTGDPIVPYAGGDTNPPNGLPVVNHFIGAMATFQKFQMFDGCTGMAMDTGNGCQTVSQCKDGVEVTLCTSPGGGHVPGDPDIGWNMLKKHPLR